MIFSLMAHFLVKLRSCEDVGEEKYSEDFLKGQTYNFEDEFAAIRGLSSVRETF